MKLVLHSKMRTSFVGNYIGYDFFCFVADISNIKQACLCLRSVWNGIIQEKFIRFIPVRDRSGADLVNLPLKQVANLGMTI